MEIAEKIFYNGNIITMNKETLIEEAVAISSGKIIWVGKNNEIEKLVGESTKKIDLKGKTMLPGMIDSHIHAPGDAYIVLFNIDLYEASSEEEILSIIKKHVKENPDKKMYFGRGFNSGVFEGKESKKGPKKEKLDEICKDKPIILTDFGGHVLWVNTAALDKYNITKETKSPAGGVIEKNPENSELWGTLKEYAKSLIPDQTFTKEQNIEAARYFQKRLNSLGYTSVFALRPPGMTIPRETIFEAFKELEEKKELKLRVNGARDIDPNEEVGPQIEDLVKLRETYDSDLIKVSSAKFFADGVIEGVTAYLLDPYEQDSDMDKNFRGEFIWNLNKMKEGFELSMKEGFQIHVHSIGDGATKTTLNVLEKAMQNMPEDNYRNSITHLQLVAEEDKDKMAKLNVIGNVQPYWHFKAPDMYESVEKPLIGNRAEKMYPLKSLVNKGVLLSASADHPVTPEPNPFYAIQAAVTRNLYNAKKYNIEPIKDIDDPKYLLNKNERISVLEILEAFTINGAYALKREKEIGSIEKGKFADLVIVSDNPLELDYLSLEKIFIIETIFEGETVYKLKEEV